jgi:hypothetical protein
LCTEISVEFPYLSFETPFTSSFIYVRPGQSNLVPNWVHHCLLPTRNSRQGRIDFCKMHHYSLWRTLNDPDVTEKPLLPHEVDILINWQKKSVVHEALLIDEATQCPGSIFGKTLVQIPERVHRLQVVAYRHLQRVPPHLLRSEITDWATYNQEPIDYTNIDYYNTELKGSELTVQQQYDSEVRAVRQEEEDAEESARQVAQQQQPEPEPEAEPEPAVAAPIRRQERQQLTPRQEAQNEAKEEADIRKALRREAREEAKAARRAKETPAAKKAAAAAKKAAAAVAKEAAATVREASRREAERTAAQNRFQVFVPTRPK